MKIGIVDADLLGRKKHRFPNLACEKISAYFKARGEETELVLDYADLYKYKKLYISKVFTDTPIPAGLQESETIHMGGTGFYFDQAQPLPAEIEHHMPDYHLYDAWIQRELDIRRLQCEQKKRPFNEKYFLQQFREYTDYSIGFLTRGCFRKCPFCVNQKYSHVFPHSPLKEFFSPERKKICLLDDNFLGVGRKKREKMLQELWDTGKRFKFKQGLDERLLDDEICEILFSSRYDGDITFAFDNIEDYELIHQKLKIIQRHKNRKSVKFYVLVGFKSTDAQDIENAFKRIELLFRYGCLPYIMRFQNKNETPWKNSTYRSLYVTLARWCNQPSMIKKMSFREFCNANQALHKTKGTLCSAMSAMRTFEAEHPKIAKKYFDMRFEKE